MSYRTILVPVGHPDNAQSAMETAFLVARRFAGHVRGLHVLPDLANPAIHGLIATRMSLDAASSDLRKLKSSAERELQRQSSELKRLFETAAARAGAAIQDEPGPANRISAAWQEVIGFESELVGELGRVFDLTVIARRGPRGSSHDTVQAALLDTGRPMLRAAPALPKRSGTRYCWPGTRARRRRAQRRALCPFCSRPRGSSSCRSVTGPSRHRARTSLRVRSPGMASPRRPGVSSRAAAGSATCYSPKPRQCPLTSWSSAPTRTAACGRSCSAA
jgi:hypothetical protein